jgi:hypothetical protein
MFCCAQALRDWDLWGPLVFTMTLVRVMLSAAASAASSRRIFSAAAHPCPLLTVACARRRIMARQAVLLSVQSPAPESVFAVVFAVVSLGAVALTLNVLLLARAGRRQKSTGRCQRWQMR